MMLLSPPLFCHWSIPLNNILIRCKSYQVEILGFEHLYWGEILYFHLGYLYINIIIIFGMRRSS
jgi:hypothetical protein